MEIRCTQMRCGNRFSQHGRLGRDLSGIEKRLTRRRKLFFFCSQTRARRPCYKRRSWRLPWMLGALAFNLNFFAKDKKKPPRRLSRGFRRQAAVELPKQLRELRESHPQKLLTAAHTYSQNWSRITSCSAEQRHPKTGGARGFAKPSRAKGFAAGFRPKLCLLRG